MRSFAAHERGGFGTLAETGFPLTNEKEIAAAGHPQADEGKPYGWKRQELFSKGDGFLFRKDEDAFVETKRKLVDECDLWAIVSVPGGCFSGAGAAVKTNPLFFTKGRKTTKIWYCDLPSTLWLL